MDIKGIGGRAERLRGALLRLIGTVARIPIVARLGGYILRFGMGLMLPRGIVLGGFSPFGIAFAASLGAGEGSIFGVIGTMLGYFGIMGGVNGLKYVAISILIYTAGFVFRGTHIMEKSWFMPLAAAVSTAAVGFVFVAQTSFAPVETVFFITEILLVTACTYAYQMYFNPGVMGEAGIQLRGISLALLCAALVLPLGGTVIVGGASVGRVLAAYFVMSAGYHSGVGAGSIAAVVMGLAAGMAGEDPAYCAMYGFAGVCAALFAEKGKLPYIMVYLISNAAAMFWLTAGSRISVLYEAFFASVFFILTSDFFTEALPLPENAPTSQATRRVRGFLQQRLHTAALAFGELGNMLSASIGREKENPGNIAAVFNHPASRVCRKCTLSGSCWEKEYISTRDALNSVTGAMRERGRLEAGDLPLHFTSRCIHLKEFLDEVNRELIAYRYRGQFRRRIEESRRVICGQYRAMAEVFDRISRDVAKQPKFDLRAESGVRTLLREMGVCGASVCVYRDGANHVHLQIEGRDLDALTRDTKNSLEQLSDAVGVSLAAPEKVKCPAGFSFLARQAEPLCASVGIAVHRKHGSEISGDTGSYFKLEDGRLCVILSDGMGSGSEAASESSDAVRMLERFLRSGIDPATSLATINSALVIKNAELGGFATLDLACIDLFTGECELHKMGSAPSYVKRGRHIRRVCAASLPAGVGGSTRKSDRTRMKLHCGDVLVLASDGVAEISGDLWLQELISEHEGESAKVLAADIMNAAFAKYGCADDMTVMTVRISRG